MKAGFVMTVVFALLAGSTYAQKVQKTRKLAQEEVPVMIVQAFQKDFSNLSQEGTWKLTDDKGLIVSSWLALPA